MTIKDARKKAKLTQKEVAQKIGVTSRAYQHYETGRREPRVVHAIRLAKTLGTSVEELFKNDCS